MKPPSHAEVYESPSSVYWFDEDGVLCIVGRQGPEISVEERRTIVHSFRQKFGEKKYCGLFDITNSKPSSHEQRIFNSQELPRIFSAIAFVSRSPLGRMMAQMFLGIRRSPIPTKVFAEEQEAKEWLRQYL